MKKQTIICPNCLKKIEIKLVETLKSVMMEGFTIHKDGSYSSPRGKFNVEGNKIKERIHFLLSNWADKVIVYNMDGEKMEEYWK
jgi:hypothetical protein